MKNLIKMKNLFCSIKTMSLVLFLMAISLSSFAQYYNDVFSYTKNGWAYHGIKIKTNIPFVSSQQMPTIMLEGYDYGTTTPIDIKLVYYIYQNKFIKYKATSTSSYMPDIYLSNENGKVVIFIDDQSYYTRFHVRAYANMSEKAEWFSGWTHEDKPKATGLPAGQQVLVPYGNVLPTSDIQMQNARATGYSIVASKNPGVDFSILMIPWDGVNTLEHNANNQIHPNWHAQAAVKGNYFTQAFNGSDFRKYSSVVDSQEQFDIYKDKGTQWWIVCSTLPPYSNKYNFEGNVGIGTTDTKGYKLAVAGKVIAEEIKVELKTNWPDYVFDDNYALASLEETENYINEKGHLKDIPSAKEVVENGINLGEIQSKLLQKIEELTLYTIQQQKLIEDQAAEMETFKNTLAEFKQGEDLLKEITK